MDTLFIFLVIFLLLDILLIFLLRKLKKNISILQFVKKWSAWADKHKEIPLWQHSVVVLFGFCLSTVYYLLLIDLFKPRFSLPPTEAINWYTVHNYPRQQDMFYFVTAFSFIFIVTSLLWLLWLVIKNKK